MTSSDLSSPPTSLPSRPPSSSRALHTHTPPSLPSLPSLPSRTSRTSRTSRRIRALQFLFPVLILLSLVQYHYIFKTTIWNDAFASFHGVQDLPFLPPTNGTKEPTRQSNYQSNYSMPVDYSRLNFTSYHELCSSCRYNPEANGKTTCLDRAQFLLKKYPQSFATEEEAKQSVMEAEPGHCSMVKFVFDDAKYAKYDNYLESAEEWKDLNGLEDGGDGGDGGRSVLFSLLDSPASNSSVQSDPLKPIKPMNPIEPLEPMEALPSHLPSLQPLAAHIPKNFKLYLYDNLPSSLTTDVERQMLEAYTSNNITYQNFRVDLVIMELFRSHPSRVLQIEDSTADTTDTTDTAGSAGSPNATGSNTNSTNSNATNALTPQDIHLFVVPYPHASHCISVPNWQNECKHVDSSQIQSQILNQLKYYKGNEQKHLFVNAMEVYLAHPLVRNLGLSLTLGPRLRQDQWHEHIIMPYLNEQPPLQPSMIHSRPSSWYTSPRKYSLAYFFGSTNKRMNRNYRIYRQYFMEEVTAHWKNVSLIGGMPYVLEAIGREDEKGENGGKGEKGEKGDRGDSSGSNGKDREGGGGGEGGHSGGGRNKLHGMAHSFMKTYAQSIFCPTLPGDAPPQKRFFDVILVGCIPVVLSFNTSMEVANPFRKGDEANGGNAGNKGNGMVSGTTKTTKSWHSTDGHPIQDSYPFAKHSHTLPPHKEIDYESFVVQIQGGVQNIKPTLEALLKNETEIRRRQLELSKVVHYFSYGVGRDAHRYEDAFSIMLESVIYSLENG